MSDSRHNDTVVGSVRPSTMTFSHGVGSLVDFPHISGMVMGLDYWDHFYTKRIKYGGSSAVIEEQRLLTALHARPGFASVEELRRAPFLPDDQQTASWQTRLPPAIGVPVAPFPQWMLCPACRLLAPLTSGLFALKPSPYRPEETRYAHTHCRSGKSPSVVPARFIVACEAGHLDDFPWLAFVHRGQTTCRASLRLKEFGSTGEAALVNVSCETCGMERRMSDAFRKDTEIPAACTARNPHLGESDDRGCKLRMRTILLGASNVWFPVIESALSIPPLGSDLDKTVDQYWNEVADISSLDDIAILNRRNMLSRFAEFPPDDLLTAIERRRASAESPMPDDDPTDLLTPEWQVLSNPDKRRNFTSFEADETRVPRGFESVLERVVLVRRLREVSCVTGFTRIESPDGPANAPVDQSRVASISRSAPTWLPASESRGEGIFLQFREDRVRTWEAEFHRSHGDRYQAGRERWAKRNGGALSGPDDNGFARTMLIHTFAHVLMRTLALGSGYAMASIRERLYAVPANTPVPMAGVLLMTSASDSEGTLGGLVRLGEPEELGLHLRRALESAEICASDPLCSEHQPEATDPAKVWSACHACLFAPETSCCMGNNWLDRSVIVQTFQMKDLRYFPLPDDLGPV